jgi:hypothetical protein
MLDTAMRSRFLCGQAVQVSSAAGEARVYGPDFLGLAEVDASGKLQPVRLIKAAQ